MLVSLGGLGLSWRHADRAVNDATRVQALTLSELIAGNFGIASKKTSPEQAHRSVTDAFRSDSRLLQDVSEMRVLDRKGVVRWSRNVEEIGKPWPDAQRLLGAPPDSRVTVTSSHAEVVRPLGGLDCASCHTGDAFNLGVLQIGFDEPRLHVQVAQVFRAALVSLLLIGLVLFLTTALSLHFFLSRPLRRLAGMMRRAEEGDFLVRAPVSGSDELGQLSEAFNRMLARLTEMKVAEIDTHRDLAHAQEQLSLKEALEARLKELSLLYDVARSLNSTLELPELFQRVSTLVTERMMIPQFSIMLPDAKGGLEVKYSLPRGSAEGLAFAPGEGVCGRAAKTMKAIYVPDLATDPTFLAKGTQAANGSLLAVPMVHKDTLLGVLNFERPQPAAFDAADIELFTAVADQVGMAVQNARLYEETLELSITDALTGVPNRRHLFARLEMEIARAHRFGTGVSFLMIDIDHFKKLNDAAGHRAGDITLRQVSDLMRVIVRKVDTLGRYGGEEFALVLPQVSKAEAIEVAEKLRSSVEQHPFIHGASQPGGKVTISVGVAHLPTDASTLEKFVDCADSALYASKRGGRNKVTGYEPGMELHPGRERGPMAQKRTRSGEQAAVTVAKSG